MHEKVGRVRGIVKNEIKGTCIIKNKEQIYVILHFNNNFSPHVIVFFFFLDCNPQKMPHVSAGSSASASTSSGASSAASARIRSDDPNDCDEVKVFNCAEDEGEGEPDDVINEDKRDLIRATECDQVRMIFILYVNSKLLLCV